MARLSALLAESDDVAGRVAKHAVTDAVALVRRFLQHIGTGSTQGLLGVRNYEQAVQAYQELVKKGLQFLARQQHKDGHWEANGGQFSSAMTGIAATTLLMEGSTVKNGKAHSRALHGTGTNSIMLIQRRPKQ